MPDTEPSHTDTGAAPTTHQSREITDPKAMRALAHPIRLAILDAIREEGELTATRAAELLNQSPGNMSWHLQTLAKYGFIVEADGAKGRSRPWKIAPGTNTFSATDANPGSKLRAATTMVAATQGLRGRMVQRLVRQGRHELPDLCRARRDQQANGSTTARIRRALRPGTATPRRAASPHCDVRAPNAAHKARRLSSHARRACRLATCKTRTCPSGLTHRGRLL
jgi:DNA-binding transcriptional ArsR family regulator